MENRKLGLIVVLALCAGLYAARRAPEAWGAWRSTNQHEIACQRAELWLSEVVSTSKKTTSAVPAELTVLRRHCWDRKT